MFVLCPFFDYCADFLVGEEFFVNEVLEFGQRLHRTTLVNGGRKQ